MVSILPSERTPLDVFGRQLGEAVQNVFPGAVERGLNRGQLQKSLEDLKNVASDPNRSNLDMIISALQAGAGLPGSEKYLSTLLPELMKASQAAREERITRPGINEDVSAHVKEKQATQTEKQEPFVLKRPDQTQTQQFFPTNIMPTGGPGQVPAETTTRKKLALSDPNQKRTAARNLVIQRRKEGTPITFEEAKAEVDAYEEDKKAYNDQIDKEQEARVKGQQSYGQKGIDELKKVYPEATSEDEQIFAKRAEEYSQAGESEADIIHHLARDATNFKNAISNVRKDISAPRLYNALHRNLLGTYKNFERSGNDIRKHIEPLIEMGLWDKARNLIDAQGYYPEETEIIVNPLGNQEKSILNSVPVIPKPKKIAAFHGVEVPVEKPQINLDNIKDALVQLKQADPNFSLLLARKFLEDRGYDWRSFKDALNDLESQGYQLTDDQKTQRGHLDQPPLNILEKILESINVIGR